MHDLWEELSREVSNGKIGEPLIDFALFFSDLDPLQAPHWCVRVRMTENPVCLLGISNISI